MKNEVNFALTPEWVLLAPISADAVRLYGILNRYAGKSRRATPGRQTLAGHLDKSVTTVDRCVKELKDIQAIEVRNRTSKAGDPTSNEYILKVTPPKDFAAKPLFDVESIGEGVAAPVMTPLPTDEGTPEAEDTVEVQGGGRASDDTSHHGRDDGTRADDETGSRASDDLTNQGFGTNNTLASDNASASPLESKGERQRRRKEIWDTLADIFDPKDAKLTRTEQKGRGKVVSELLDVGATGAEVKRRARMFNTRFPGASITAFALIKHWNGLQPPKLSVASEQPEPEKCAHGVWKIAHCEDCAAEGLYDQGRAS